MFRHRPRTSRALIGLLVVTIVLGLVSYWHNLSRSKAKEITPSAAGQPAAPVTPIARQQQQQQHQQVAAADPMAGLTKTETPKMPFGTAFNTLTSATGTPGSPTTQPRPLANTNAAAAGSNAQPLAQARAKQQSGDLLEAREILNAALLSNRLSPADAKAAKQQIAEISQTVVFSSKRFPDDAFGGTYSVQSGDRLSRIAANHDVTWELLGRLNGITDPSKLRAGAAIKVVTGPFHAVVDKSDFTMDLYLGEPPAANAGAGGAPKVSMYITSFAVGLGSDDSTPTGTWMVEPGKKLKNPTYFSPRGEGVIEADDPKNPLGEFWIGLTGIDGHAVGKASYGIHGTIEPDSIGKMESLGCIRLKNEDVALVYEMLVEGKSTVIVKE